LVFTPRIIAVVGTPGSGKDLLIRAVNDLGIRHAQIVPKHTSRLRRYDDGNEMICNGDSCYNIDGCDIIYENFGDRYGIESLRIWEGLKNGVFQVAVVSNIQAINKLKELFGELLVLVYVHSEMSADDYLNAEAVLGSNTDYVKKRAASYRAAFDIYLENYLAFNHVLIYSGIQEDLFDQIFRLFRAYEHRRL